MHLIRAKKLFEASLQSDMDLLKEMKKIKSGRDNHNELPDNVEGASGEEDIASKFREVYSTLYNSSGSKSAMEVLKQEVQSLIGSDSMEHVAKVTGDAVKKGAVLLNPDKSDVSGGFASDALLHAPDLLFHHLAAVFRDWLVHGTITSTLLAVHSSLC